MSTDTLNKKVTHRVASHETIIALAMWASNKKAEIQASLDGGKPVTQFAEEKNVSPATMRSVFTNVGLAHGRQKVTRGEILRDMLVVLNRVCRELNIGAPEIAKHL